MKKSMTRGSLIFTCVWLGIFAVAFFSWAFYLGEYSKLLAEYESIQKDRTAEEIFIGHFRVPGAKEMAEYCADIVSPYDKDGAAEDAISALIDGKTITYEPEDDGYTYAVLADGEKFAYFTLIETKESDSVLGYSPLELGEIGILLEPAVDVVIFAPKSAVVKVNRKTVGDECREGDYVVLDGANHSDPEALKMAYYRISGLFTDPAVTVESHDGSVKFGLDFDKGTSTYSAEYSYRTYLTVAE